MRLDHRQGCWSARASAVLAALLLCGRASAQTGPNLLVLPWDEKQAVDTRTEATVESSVNTRENPADNVQLNAYEAQGRWRLFPELEATPRLGYDVLYFDVNTSDRALPRHLWDTSVGFAQPVAKFADDKWFAVVTGAAGYAGNSPFDDGRAWYATANVIVGRQFNADKALIFALNYDGNRTFLPDVPVPAFAFKNRLNDHFTYVLGLPLSSLTYTPVNGLQIDAGWSLLSTFSGRVGYEFLKHYQIYGQYDDRFSAFHDTDRPNPDRRLFLQEHRVEAGFRWNPTKLVRLSVGGGWAFGQEFSTGYDTRDIHPLRHLDDGPFGRIYLEIGL